jgi:hypothetical protein
MCHVCTMDPARGKHKFLRQGTVGLRWNIIAKTVHHNTAQFAVRVATVVVYLPYPPQQLKY